MIPFKTSNVKKKRRRSTCQFLTCATKKSNKKTDKFLSTTKICTKIIYYNMTRQLNKTCYIFIILFFKEYKIKTINRQHNQSNLTKYLPNKIK